MSKFLVLGIFGLLVQLSHQLPMKESTSTEKDPNEHKEEGDSPQHNLENIIGKFQHMLPHLSSSHFSHHCV